MRWMSWWAMGPADIARQRERDASQCMRKHQAFALAPVSEAATFVQQRDSKCVGRCGGLYLVLPAGARPARRRSQ
jgi:hypothetical protein